MFFLRQNNKDKSSTNKDDGSSTSAQKSSLRAKPIGAKRSLQILSKKDDIPSYSAVMSISKGIIPLSIEQQKNYVVLLISSSERNVLILCSTAIYIDGNSEPDHEYLTIRSMVQREGYNIKAKILAKPEIIGIIYESGLSSVSTEDRKRAATKIQIDFDNLLRAAVEQDASDIHIEVGRDGAKVRFRKNGDLSDFSEWPVNYARTMAGVIYQVIADEKDTTFDEGKPQDAIIDRELGESTRLRVRLATIPAYPSGFNMIMRILKMGQGGARQSLNSLGYEKSHLSLIRRAVAKPVGVVIMAGTTGSGKSTSLNSMIGEKIDLFGGKIKVITVEDPPEYKLEGATQVPVVRSRSQAKAGNKDESPFASVFRAALRSDPDILMIGEVRDSHTAELLTHAVQSGHQVFTTIHASGAMDVISRLRSIGVGDDVIGGQNFLSAMIYQTLLKVICPHCSNDFRVISKNISNDSEEEFLQRVNKYIEPSLIAKLKFISNEKSCQHCVNGVVGRTVASEVILPDPYMLQCFRDRRDHEAFAHYRKKGGKIALEHGLQKALLGQVDLRDVEHKLDQITYLEEMEMASNILAGRSSSKRFVIDASIFSGTNSHPENEISLDKKTSSTSVAIEAQQPFVSKLLSKESNTKADIVQLMNDHNVNKNKKDEDE